MSDTTADLLREEVRSRYAEAARAVLEPRPGVTAQCIESSATGFADASVTFTTETAPGLHSAIIRAVKPAQLAG
jgi:hypothetical protein